MSLPPNPSGSAEVTSMSSLAIATSPEDRPADRDAVIDERASTQEATHKDVMKPSTPAQEEGVHSQEATDEEVIKQSTPVQQEVIQQPTPVEEEDVHGQPGSPFAIAQEILESVEEFEPVGADEGGKHDQVPDSQQRRSRHETTISMIPETASVGEESKVVKGAAEPEPNDNTAEAGFDLQKVYDRDDLEQVTDFPYQRLGGKRIKKAGHLYPA